MVFKWPSLKRDCKTSVVLPVSNISILPDLRSKTYFVGQVARALAIYRVDNLILFKDRYSSNDDLNLFRLIVTYLLTPPYLRKKLIPIVPELRFIGILPPLNIATHNPEGKKPSVGDLREGIVIQSLGKKAKVFIGYRRACITTSSRELRVNERITVRIVSVNPLKCEEVDPKDVTEYLGFNLLVANNEDELLEILNDLSGIVIITSKFGDSISKLGLRKAVIKHGRESGGYKILFGNHEKDFDELVSKDLLNALNVRFKMNFIPLQGTLTVRTAEALHAVLAIINADHETFRY